MAAFPDKAPLLDCCVQGNALIDSCRVTGSETRRGLRGAILDDHRPIICGVMANLCFSLGWVVGTIRYRGRPRAALYKTGLIFFVILTALPGIWAVVGWCITLYTGKRLD